MKRKSHGQFYAVKMLDGEIDLETAHRGREGAESFFLGQRLEWWEKWQYFESKGYSIVKVTIREHIDE